MKPQGYIPPTASPSAHEGADLHIGNVVKVAATLGFVLGLSILLLTAFFRLMEKAHPDRTSEAAPLVLESDLPPLPRLQTNPLRDLQAVRDVENSHLESYAWIDRERGIAQIPIERAMILWTKNNALIAARPEISAAPTNAVPAPGTTELQMRRQKAQETPHAP